MIHSAAVARRAGPGVQKEKVPGTFSLLTNYLRSSSSVSATLGGANPGDFAVQKCGSCPYPSGQLAANSSCTYHMTFKPSLTGAESATLSVSDADGTQRATLKGTGK